MDPMQQKIDKFVRTMMYRNAPPMWFVVGLPVLLLGLAIATCVLTYYTYKGDGDKVVVSQVMYAPVVRVFMSAENRIIFFVQQVNGAIHAETVSAEKIVWVMDVAADLPMWAEWQQYYMSKNVGHRTEMTVHIHSVADVGGGNWDNGKFGSGTTTVVE